MHADGGLMKLGNWIADNSRVIQPQQRFAPQELEPWGDPQPLSAAAEPLEDWPVEAYPPVIAEMVKAVTETMRVPAPLVGLNALIVASVAQGNTLQVQIKPGHEQFGNLFGLAIVQPGGGKTPVGHALQAPLTDWENENREAWQNQISHWGIASNVVEARVKALERRAANELDEVIRQTLIDEMKALRAGLGAPPPEPRLFCNDATPEALARRMFDNGGAIGIVSPEGRKVLKIAGGRYSGNGGDVDIWLAGHSGRDPIRVDRMAADKLPFAIPRPCLAAYVAVQPDAIRLIAANDELTHSGWLGRFLFIMPEHSPGTYPEASIPVDIATRYNKAIRALIELRHVDRPTTGEARIVALTPDAFRRWIEMHDDLQRELAAAALAQAHPAYGHWLSKAAEHIARIALVLRAIRHVSENGVSLDQVDETDILNAGMLMSCLKTHARRVFGVMGEYAGAAQARALWAVLQAHRSKLAVWRQQDIGEAIEAVKPRDIARQGWAGLDTAGALRALELLSVKGWVRRRIYPARSSAGQSHLVFELHPNPNGGRQ
jgi:hypothetical protein